MDTSHILTSIDQELERLTTARAALLAIATPSQEAPKRRGPGRPPKNSVPDVPKPPKRKMSAAGRARIAAAQKARWAAKKSSTTASVLPPKKSATKVPATVAKRLTKK